LAQHVFQRIALITSKLVQSSYLARTNLRWEEALVWVQHLPPWVSGEVRKPPSPRARAISCAGSWLGLLRV
jgi:hypothetical protein